MHLVNCKNCGKQTMIDGGDPDEKCAFCHEPALRLIQDKPERVGRYKNNPEAERKAAIARDAAVRGFKVVAAEHGLKWQTVRAWVLTYCRKSSLPFVKDTDKTKKAPQVVVGSATAEKKAKLDKLIEKKGRRLKEGKRNPLEFPTNGRLPAFPSFDSAWPMLTQIEWFKTYRELAVREK